MIFIISNLYGKKAKYFLLFGMSLLQSTVDSRYIKLAYLE